MATSLMRIAGRQLTSQSLRAKIVEAGVLKICSPSFTSMHWYSTRSSTGQRRAVNAPLGNSRWKPGLEPGLDPVRSNNGSLGSLLDAKCNITVVDYSEDRIETKYLDNGTLPQWIESDRQGADWVKCRWINVDGLSWDVIQALGRYKNLHKLAIEDLVNTENRTKADW
jgi:hypothetical protein